MLHCSWVSAEAGFVAVVYGNGFASGSLLPLSSPSWRFWEQQGHCQWWSNVLQGWPERESCVHERNSRPLLSAHSWGRRELFYAETRCKHGQISSLFCFGGFSTPPFHTYLQCLLFQLWVYPYPGRPVLRGLLRALNPLLVTDGNPLPKYLHANVS